MPEYASNDTDIITKRIKEIRCTEWRRCFKKAGLNAAGCWCINGGPDGATLPCSVATDAD